MSHCEEVKKEYEKLIGKFFVLNTSDHLYNEFQKSIGEPFSDNKGDKILVLGLKQDKTDFRFLGFKIYNFSLSQIYYTWLYDYEVFYRLRKVEYNHDE